MMSEDSDINFTVKQKKLKRKRTSDINYNYIFRFPYFTCRNQWYKKNGF